MLITEKETMEIIEAEYQEGIDMIEEKQISAGTIQSYNYALENNMIKRRNQQDPLFIWIDIPTINGGTARGLCESATTECVIIDSLIQNNKVLNRLVGFNSIFLQTFTIFKWTKR